MRGFIDLHSHWVADIDDGAITTDDSIALLDALKAAGFDTVVATPHMRPGMFDNTREDLERAYAETHAAVAALDAERRKPGSRLTEMPPLPELHLASEHFFDDVVFQRFLDGKALLYPGGHAALVEFPARAFPAKVTHRFFDLMRRRIRPVLAHPERYEQVWTSPASLEPLMDGGALLLLDVAALAGKYGRAPRRAAEELLERGYYYAACSDAHKASDVVDVKVGIERLFETCGDDDAKFFLSEGPRAILDGKVEG